MQTFVKYYPYPFTPSQAREKGGGGGGQPREGEGRKGDPPHPVRLGQLNNHYGFDL